VSNVVLIPIIDRDIGGCPECGGNDGYINIEREHFGLCQKHKFRWWIGSNVFSGWREENERIWRENEKRLTDFRLCEPVFTFRELRRRQSA